MKENDKAKAMILLVEDDFNLGFVVQDLLREEGYKVHLSKDGKEGLMQFNREPYDLILLDVMMPKKDGFSLARDVRKVNSTIPILFLTAKSMTEDKVEGFIRIEGDENWTVFKASNQHSFIAPGILNPRDVTMDSSKTEDHFEFTFSPMESVIPLFLA